MRKLIAYLLTATATAFFATGLNASVIITFQETLGNVVATTSGSFTVPVGGGSNGFSNGTAGLTYELYNLSGSYTLRNIGTYTDSGIQPAAVTSSGDSFGYTVGYLVLPTAATGVFVPQTTWQWNGQTMTSLGLGYLTTTPVTVYTANGETISIARASAIPEPSTYAAFAALAALGLAMVSRRKKAV